MPDYNLQAGQMLRQLRKQRQLTQTQAALLLHTSTPVLSRKERGLDSIERG
jgi:transcriptional regulator with XRE-family HTH domain